jgi:glucosylglycerate synthase
MEGMNNFTPLRDITKVLLGRVSPADLLIGIPCFNNAETVGKVVEAAAAGAAQYFPGKTACIVVSDGGSTLDDSREVALAAMKKMDARGVVGIYRGIPGKGSALRMIFAAASEVKAEAIALLDADLRSTTPLWIERLLGPIASGKYDFVAPLYSRYKFDGTITNNVTYNTLRCLFGKRVRQPIGGEFALTAKLASELEQEPVWDTDIARFGVDIWMTVQALVRKARVCQTHLGVKVHDPKDPAASLEPMFRQVVGTLFTLMEQTESHWRDISGSDPTDVWGEPGEEEPEAFPVNYDRLLQSFYVSWETLRETWHGLLCEETFDELKIHVETGRDAFIFPTDLWARIIFEFAAAFHHRQQMKNQIIEVLSPLYFARVASFINRTREMSNRAAEAVVEEQARVFELKKPYLLEMWSSASR